MKERATKIYTFMILGILVFGTLYVLAAEPAPTDVRRGASSRRINSSLTSLNAQAGNVTGLNINQTRVTDIWQGFYGNISGRITLDNANNRTFYDWTSAATAGEVYASRSVISSWTTVNCANNAFKASEDTTLGITSSWVDSINSTFASNGPSFSVGSVAVNNCPGTRAYNSTGAATFWNVLINVSTTPVYVSVLNDNQNAFDNGGTADFEMLVPTTYSTGTATYYFYAELN